MIRVGINGFGRIGRYVTAILAESCLAKVVAVNDPMPLESALYLMNHDSARVVPQTTSSIKDDGLLINDSHIRFFPSLAPNDVPWGDLGVDVVIEASGKFRTRTALSQFLLGGAKRVITTYPIYSEGDITLLPRINEHKLNETHKIISAGTCTAQGLAPVVSIIENELGILQGSVTSVHAYTSDQPAIDTWHAKGLRKGRASSNNIIPVDTIAVKAMEQVMPGITGKLKGFSLRVTVVLGAFLDLTLSVNTPVDVKGLNDTLVNGAANRFPDILQVRYDEPVSSDVLGSKFSAMVDAKLTEVVGDTFIKVCFWYDNETGFSNRLAEMITGPLATILNK